MSLLRKSIVTQDVVLLLRVNLKDVSLISELVSTCLRSIVVNLDLMLYYQLGGLLLIR